jgi:WD40 repeat protein
MSLCSLGLFVCAYALADPGTATRAQAQASLLPQGHRARTDQYGDPLPPGALARLGTVRLRHAGEIQCIAFAPAGILASAGQDGTVRFWEVTDGRELRRLPKQKGIPSTDAIAFARDGRLFATAAGATISLWEMPAAKNLRQFRTPDSVASVAFSPAGDLLAAAIANSDGPVIQL